MIEVIRIRNIAALQLPAIRGFLTKALSVNCLVEDVPAAVEEFDYWVSRKHAGLFIVREDGSWVAMGFAQWGESAFAPHVTILHVYNEGTPAALTALNSAIVEFARLGGYNKGLSLDMNRNDRAFRVLFKEGGTLKPLGTAYHFLLDGDTENGR